MSATVLGIANIQSPHVVNVLMDDGQVLAKISEQTIGKPLHRPPSDGQHDKGVSMDKLLHVTKDATVPKTVETEGPMTQNEHLFAEGP